MGRIFGSGLLMGMGPLTAMHDDSVALRGDQPWRVASYFVYGLGGAACHRDAITIAAVTIASNHRRPDRGEVRLGQLDQPPPQLVAPVRSGGELERVTERPRGGVGGAFLVPHPAPPRMEAPFVGLPDLVVDDLPDGGERLQRRTVAQAGARRVVDQPVSGAQPGEAGPLAVAQLVRWPGTFAGSGTPVITTERT
jgi:hypothetical protein